MFSFPSLLRKNSGGGGGDRMGNKYGGVSVLSSILSEEKRLDAEEDAFEERLRRIREYRSLNPGYLVGLPMDELNDDLMNHRGGGVGGGSTDDGGSRFVVDMESDSEVDFRPGLGVGSSEEYD